MIIQDKIFKDENVSSKTFQTGEYENCTFKGIIFSEMNLNGSVFTSCSFENCDWSLAKLKNVSFQEAEFIGCKLMGLRFDECKPFLLSFNFENCILNYSSFFKLKIKGTRFINCQLEECDFSEADLSKSVWTASNLLNAKFDRTKLLEADFRSAQNLIIDPDNNTIRKAKFSQENVLGLLIKYEIIID